MKIIQFSLLLEKIAAETLEKGHVLYRSLPPLKIATSSLQSPSPPFYLPSCASECPSSIHLAPKVSMPLPFPAPTHLFKAPVLTHNQLVYYGNACGMKTVSETLSAATLLHSFGSILYFRNNPILKDCIILEPAWLASLVAPMFIQEVFFFGDF
jgi:hypothetical protein